MKDVWPKLVLCCCFITGSFNHSIANCTALSSTLLHIFCFCIIFYISVQLFVSPCTFDVQGLIPAISADAIAAEEPVLMETDDHEEGELVSSPSQHRDLDAVAEDTRTTKIRRIVYVRRQVLCLSCIREILY